MPALALAIISYISLAMKAAPQVASIYQEGKALVAHLFTSGLITLQQQQDLHAWMDAHQAATLAGQIPPEFTVE